MKEVTIKDALQRVADHPIMPEDTDLTQVPVHELIARNLFEIANKGNVRERGSLTRANKARKMILDRLVGKRKPGSHPATRTPVEIDFVDLTGTEEVADGSQGVQSLERGHRGPGATDPGS